MAGGPVVLGLELGDWATWISGIGSMIAAGSAVYAARKAISIAADEK